MLIKLSTLDKSSSTSRTKMWPFSRVHSQMYFQATIYSKSLPTQITLESFLGIVGQA